MISKRIVIGMGSAALALAAIGHVEASCRPVFVAGEGVIDSCTGKHRSPYPDPPPQPTVIEVVVHVDVHPQITVVNNVSAVAVANASANASSSSSSKGPKYIVRPRVVKR